MSLIIHAHRPGPMLEDCLNGVAALDPMPLDTILVIDDNFPAVAESAKYSEFQVVTLPHANYVSAARNATAQMAKARFLFFLDSDVLPPRHFVADALASLHTLLVSLRPLNPTTNAPPRST